MNSSMSLAPENDLALRERLRQDMPGLGLQLFDELKATSGTGRPRRGYRLPPTADFELLALTRQADGVLRWDFGSPSTPMLRPAHRAGRAALSPGRVVEQFVFKRIPSNQVGATLEKIDRHLTPVRGLRKWNGQALEPFDGSKAAGQRVLLLIHGTFSTCDNLIEELAAAPDNVGKKFLVDARKNYDLVLTFDHPTVAVSPLLNAFDLAALLRPTPSALDVVCHSRGGLVTRWFFEGFADPAMKSRRAVMVATTSGGTSLAAPHRLKASLHYLANVGDKLGRLLGLATLHPFLTAAGGLMQVAGSVVDFAAATPALDAAVALIPGLNGQSRVGNNPELLRLHANTGGAGATYFAVKGNFETTDPGWNFLEYFSRPMQRLADAGADLIFEGQNDLVVDTESMDYLATDPLQQPVRMQLAQDFQTTSEVYHTNYFRQPQTIAAICRSLAI